MLFHAYKLLSQCAYLLRIKGRILIWRNGTNSDQPFKGVPLVLLLRKKITFKLQRAKKEKGMVQCHLFVEVRLTAQLSLASKTLWGVSDRKICFRSCGLKEFNNFCSAFKVRQLEKQNGKEGPGSDLSSLFMSPLGNFLALEGLLSSNRLHQPSVCSVLSLWQ